MNEKLKARLRTVWSEPRHFFFWLGLFSLLGLVAGYAMEELRHSPSNPPPWVQTCACACAAGLMAGLLAGVFGFILAWIPPIHRFLVWVLRRRFFVLACLVTLVALYYTEQNWRGQRAWNHFKQAAAAQGEYFDISRLAPPPVPDDQNFAMAPIVASTYSGVIDRNGRKIATEAHVVNRLALPIDVPPAELPKRSKYLEAPSLGNWQKGLRTDLAAWQEYYRKLAAVTNLFPVPSQRQTPAADVLLALSKHDSAIEELRQAGRRPYSRFPLEYDADDPGYILFPHLGSLKGCTRLLELRSAAELQLDQTDKALDDVRLMIRLTDAIRNEPILISHLVRIALLNIALQPVWEGTAGQKWSDAQLAALEDALGRLDFLADYRTAMRGEMACVSGIIDYLRRTRDSNLFGSGENLSAAAQLSTIGFRLAPAGWFHQEQLRCVGFEYQWYLSLADQQDRTVSPAAARLASGAFAAQMRTAAPFSFLGRELLPALGTAVRKFATAQANVDLARVGCALERYRLAHGQYPDALDALAPQFIEKVPHDVIDGGPLHYRRTDGGPYLLYSVGWNETDDGGQFVLTKSGAADMQQGDWRWPSRAE